MNRPALFVFCCAALLAAVALAHEFTSPEEFPSVAPDVATQTIELPELGLLGQWPEPYQHGPGWEVRTQGGVSTVRAECTPPKGYHHCLFRFARDSMRIERATKSAPAAEWEHRMIGPDGRELRYNIATSEEPRMCTSKLTGVLTLGDAAYRVECTASAEDWCGGGGKWCIELLAGLEAR